LSSSIVPLSTFTLFFSELNTEPCGAVFAGSSFRFEIPTTPWVLPVICGRAFASFGAGVPSAPAAFGAAFGEG